MAPTDADKGKARTRLRPADRREQLIRTAVHLFAQEGEAAVTVLRITQEANVSNGIFYHYFADIDQLKEDVAALVIREFTQGLTAARQAVRHIDRIAEGAVTLMREVAANRDLGAVMVQYLERHSPVLSPALALIGKDIGSGLEAGELSADTPRDLLVGFIAATLAVGARAVLAGSDPDLIGEEVAGTHLLMLGVPRGRAHAAAARATKQSAQQIRK